MSELLSHLGIDARLFIAQLINFSIILFVLHRFAYKPVLAMLEKRTKKIEKGLADAEAAQKKCEEMAQKEQAVLTEAKKQAKDIIDKAHVQAQSNRDDIIAAAKKESENIIAKAGRTIEEQKQQMMHDVKSEVAGLVALAVEKVVDEKIDAEKDEAIIRDVIKTKEL